MTGPQMALTAVLRFGISPALLVTGEKMPPAGHGRPRKRRIICREYRDTAGHPVGNRDAKNPPQVATGRAMVVSRFFRRFPDNHQGKHKDK